MAESRWPQEHEVPSLNILDDAEGAAMADKYIDMVQWLGNHVVDFLEP